MGDAPRTLQGIPEGPRGPVRGADADTLPAVEPPVEPPATVPSELPAGARPSASTFPAPAAAARTSERYRLGAELGRGGMGRVVEAFDTQLGRTVALKEVLPKGGESVARRFAREVQLTARLEHPSIVPLYDSGTTVDGRPFYVMRRVSGRPLDELVRRARTADERLTLLPAVLAAIDAVAHAHKRGVIHRDLKPANILVGELGETVVIDWGLAKVIGEEDETGGAATRSPTAADSLQTQIGSVFGTPGFMAPEQARGEELDPRGDVYALGATLYQVLAGRPPHAGNSATEVIDRTRKHDMKPLGDIAPGTPPELIAIVDKALAFEAANRYPNAGALGEDVRRFLAGQLVAAHRYTTAQRVKRFARRHRSPLAVAALAFVAVAVLAWISVHRIVRERDAANDAREAEARGKTVAQAALAEAQSRADQLTLQQARAFLEKNPTLAAAMLKQLPPGSPRMNDARGLAQSASVRGIAWAMQAPDELTVFAELSPDSQYVLQITRDTMIHDGALRVWDVERRRLVLTRPVPLDTRALWVGAKILLTHQEAAPELLDPTAGSIQTLAIPPISDAFSTARGDRVLILSMDHAAGMLDMSDRTVAPIWPGHTVLQAAMAQDGSWYALGNKQEVVVQSASGVELAKRAADVMHIEVSRFDELAILDASTPHTIAVRLCQLHIDPKGDAAPVWTEMPATAPNFVLNLAFRGHRLVAFVSPSSVVSWTGKRTYEELRIDQFTYKLVEAGDDLIFAPSGNGQIQYAGQAARGALMLPSVMPNLKVLGRAGSSRIIAIARGLIVGYELNDIAPHRIDAPVGTIATFVGDDTLLLWSNAMEDWVWFDVASGKRTPLHYDLKGMPQVISVDELEGRVLVAERTAAGVRLVLLRKGTREVTTLATSPMGWGHLLPGDIVTYGVGDGRVFVRRGTEAPRELAKLEGIAQAVVPIGRSGFAAISDAGELVRGDVATGQLVRTHIRVGTRSVIGADKRGRVLIAEDNRLFVWDSDIVELAHFDKPIEDISGLDDGVLVELTSHEVVRVAATPGSQPVRVLPPSQLLPVVSPDGKLVLGTSVTGAVAVVEVPSGVTWEMPLIYESTMQLSIAPTSRRVVQGGLDELTLWTLPVATGDLRGWLDERTEGATDGEHGIEWPWQVTHAATVAPR